MTTNTDDNDPREDPSSPWNHATVSDKPYYFIHDETYRSRRNLVVMSSIIGATWWLDLTPDRLQGFLINLSSTPEQKFFLVLWLVALYEALSFGFRLWNDYVVWRDSTIFLTHNSPTSDVTDANNEFTILTHLQKAVSFGVERDKRYYNAVYKGIEGFMAKKMILARKQKLHLFVWEIGIPYCLFILATFIVFRKPITLAYRFITS